MKKIILFAVIALAITMSITCRDELLASVDDRKPNVAEEINDKFNHTDTTVISDSTTVNSDETEVGKPISFDVNTADWEEKDSLNF